MTGGGEPLARRGQHGIAAQKSRQGIDRQHRPVLDQRQGLCSCPDLAHPSSARLGLSPKQLSRYNETREGQPPARATQPTGGRAPAASGRARSALCLTTRVHPDTSSDAAFLPPVEQSLRRLAQGPVDILLQHWPPIGGDIAGPLRLLQDARAGG
jgi:hypothetical protein